MISGSFPSLRWSHIWNANSTRWASPGMPQPVRAISRVKLEWKKALDHSTWKKILPSPYFGVDCPNCMVFRKEGLYDCRISCALWGSLERLGCQTQNQMVGSNSCWNPYHFRMSLSKTPNSPDASLQQESLLLCKISNVQNLEKHTMTELLLPHAPCEVKT
jgi:hypothetical protein